MELVSDADGMAIFGTLHIDAANHLVRVGAGASSCTTQRIANLLEYLARHAALSGVPAPDLIAHFWPHLPAHDADNSLKVAVCQANGVLRDLGAEVRIVSIRKQHPIPRKYYLRLL